MRRSKRRWKKHLRSREQKLNQALQQFIEGFDLAFDVNDPNPTSSPEKERNFRLLLRLRHLTFSFLWIRLKLHPAWRNKQWFLELPDFEDIEINQDRVLLTGDIIWWAEGKDAIGQWWPADHDPQRMGFYKMKLRGDAGKWVIEPMRVMLKLAATPKRVATYDLEFGYGSTYLRTTNDR
jgi:hypothetical protein